MKLKILLLLITIQLASIACSDSGDADVRSLATIAIENGEYNKAYDLIIDGAKNGDRELQHTVALIVYNGYGPIKEQDRNEVVLEWLLKSAELGFPDSIAWLADAYENGWFGLEKDLEVAKSWRLKNK
jgi:TPR repeat protein